MGTGENMQHLERYDVVSRGKAEGQASENGECSIVSRPKWKKRKVSVVRDFPVGCGWNAPPPPPRPTEAVVSNDGACKQIVNSSGSEAPLDSDFIEGSKNTAKSPSPQPLEDLVQIEVTKNSTNVDDNIEKPQIMCNMAKESHLKNGELNGNDSTTALENTGLVSLQNPLNDEVSELSKNSPKSETTAPVNETILSTKLFEFLKQPRTWNYPPRRKVSAVRDFPPSCGPNAPPLSKEDCTKVVASSNSINLGGGSCSPEAMPTNGTVSDDFKEKGSDTENDDNHNIKLDTLIENIVSNTFGEKEEVEDKKEESTIVVCQNDVNQQPKLKSHKHVKESDVVVNVVAGKVGNEIVVYADEVRGVGAQNGMEIVVYEPEEKDVEGEPGTMILYHNTSESLQNRISISGSKTQIVPRNDGLELQMNGGVVQGLFAAPNCPWEHPNRINRAAKKGRSLQMNEGVVQGLFAAPNCPWEHPYSINRAAKKGRSLQMNEGVVQGLFAAPNCPWGHPYSINQAAKKGRSLQMNEGVVQGLFAAPNCPWEHPYSINRAAKKECSLQMNEGVVQGLFAAPNCPWEHPYSINRAAKKGRSFQMNERVVQGLFAAPNCPWERPYSINRAAKKGCSLQMNEGVVQGLFDAPNCLWEQQNRTIKPDQAVKKGCSKSEQGNSKTEVTYEDMGALVVYDQNEWDSSEDEQLEDFHVAYRTQSQQPEYDVTLLPLGPSSSNGRDDNHENIVTRNKVRETLRIFQVIFRKLLQEEEAKLKLGGTGLKRVDLAAAKIVKDRGKYVNTGKSIVGPVPGVEVGDEFHFRVELAIIGLHRPFQAGIDYVKQDGKIVATSIVASASGGYVNVLDNSDLLIYTGSGGKDSDNQPEDQKLERGNLALKNSADEKTSVRVIRGFKEMKASDSTETKGKAVSTFTYDGLYRVEKYWQKRGPNDKLIYQFELVRIHGQPALAWNEVRKTKNLKNREGVCVPDISQGKEKMPICAINTIDDDTPPEFEYITEMIYPIWCNPIPPKGCSCAGRCSESDRCSCAVKNGVEIPYNHNGAIVEARPIVYECGPSCKCPRSCYNRVTQHGIIFQLEVFKTGSRGWGVRSLNSISSGSFICEYLGELLDDKEAEQRTGSDEYLFDIGHNFNDQAPCSEHALLSDGSEIVEDGFTIDAAQSGNVGRFINHSCSPNLYAQNVLYDHEDRRMPHIMLFAAENIPPLQELTYHYNYTIDEVRDSHGNVKKKNCYCGSSECVGRMY